MIEKTTGYKIKSGEDEEFFPTIEEAQKAALATLFKAKSKGFDQEMPTFLIENKEAILDILTTTPSSKPRGRKINGATRKRKKEELVYGAEQPKAA